MCQYSVIAIAPPTGNMFYKHPGLKTTCQFLVIVIAPLAANRKLHVLHCNTFLTTCKCQKVLKINGIAFPWKSSSNVHPGARARSSLLADLIKFIIDHYGVNIIDKLFQVNITPVV